MPELPEVETIKRDLAQRVKGLRIDAVDIYDGRVVRHIDQKKFVRSLVGRTIQDIQRRGKAIIIVLEPSGFLMVMPKMTGQLVIGTNLKETEQCKETKVVFKLSNGQYLNYNDQRLFGVVLFTERLEDVPYLQRIGREPLENNFKEDWFGHQLKRRTAPIKTLLLNQSILAGIGNIYASEILHAAGIHPRKHANRLKEKEVQSLCRFTVKILRSAIKERGTSMRNYRDSYGQKGNFINRIQVYGRQDQPCYRCGTVIQRFVQAGRSTFFCPACQPFDSPRALARGSLRAEKH
jgi:formamidopyrimidine-DNA glycosylase